MATCRYVFVCEKSSTRKLIKSIDELGIAENLVTGLCSCVATGPTSTVHVEKTIRSTCYGTVHKTDVHHVTEVQVITLTKTIPRTITSTQTVGKSVTSQVTVYVTSTVDQYSAVTDTETESITSTSVIDDYISTTETSTTTLPSIVTTTTTVTTTETSTIIIPTTLVNTDTITSTSVVDVYTTVRETSTTEVDVGATITTTTSVSEEATATTTIFTTTTSTPPPTTVDTTTTVRTPTTIDVTDTITKTTGTTTVITSAEESLSVTKTVTSTTIVTPACAGGTQTFALQVATGTAAGSYGGEYLTESLGNPNLGDYLLYPQPDILSAQSFYVQSNTLYDTNGRFFAYPGGWEQVQLLSAADAAAQGYTAVTGCSTSGGKLTCVEGGLNSWWIINYGSAQDFKHLAWGAQSDDEYYDIPGGDPSSDESPLLTLNVIPLCTL